MKKKDLEQFKKRIVIELGKVDLFGHGRKCNRVVLQFELYSGLGTYRAEGEEYCSWNCIVYKAHGRSFWLTTDMPNYDLDKLIACGLNPQYRDYIIELRDTYNKNGLKYTRLLPLFDVMKMCNCIMEIQKIANNQK